jgi:hypothetical protein
MAYSVNNRLGVDLTNTFPATLWSVAGNSTLPRPPHALGEQVWGNDGKRYTFAQANGSISASTAVCTVNASTFQATNSGGSYTSPATAMVVGDFGWFSAASV